MAVKGVYPFPIDPMLVADARQYLTQYVVTKELWDVSPAPLSHSLACGSAIAQLCALRAALDNIAIHGTHPDGTHPQAAAVDRASSSLWASAGQRGRPQRHAGVCLGRAATKGNGVAN